MNIRWLAGIGMGLILIARPGWMMAQSRNPPVDQAAVRRGPQL